jgi:hypothetical protein
MDRFEPIRSRIRGAPISPPSPLWFRLTGQGKIGVRSGLQAKSWKIGVRSGLQAKS